MNIDVTYSYAPLFVFLSFLFLGILIFFILLQFINKPKPLTKLVVSLVLAIIIAAVICGVMMLTPKDEFTSAVQTQVQEVYGVELTQQEAASFNAHLIPVGEYSEDFVIVSIDGELQELRLQRETDDRYVLLVQEMAEVERL